MNVILELHEKARRVRRRIVLPEAHDPRVRQAAAQLAAEGLVEPVLVDGGGLPAPPPGVDVVRIQSDPRVDAFAEELHGLRQHKGMTPEEAAEKVRDPLVFGSMLVRSGDCAGGVAGSDCATADVLRAGLWTIGLEPGNATLSSCFLMIFEDRVFIHGNRTIAMRRI